MFDAQIGAVEIGIVVSIFLFGVTTAQTFYYQLFSLDSKWMKRLVWAVWVIELGHSISSLHALYFYTIFQFGNLNVRTMKVPLSIALNLITSEVVCVLIQAYFLTRIYRFSQTWYLLGPCIVLLVMRFIGTAVATVEAVIMTSLNQFIDDWGWDLICILTVGAFADLAIPCLLVYLYHRAMKRSEAYVTTLAVDKLILYAIETGLLTGLLAALSLIFIKTLPSSFAWMAVYINLPKMLSNSFLANLNYRFKRLRVMHDGVNVVDMSADATSNQNTLHFNHRLRAQINVTSQQTKTVDDEIPPAQYAPPESFKVEIRNRNSSDGTQSTNSKDRKVPVIDITI